MGANSSKANPGMLITLDALGTLYRFRQPFATQYIEIAQKCGLKAKIDPKRLNQAFKTSFKSLNSELPNYGKGQLSSPKAWWKTLVNDTFRQVVEEAQIPEDLGDELYDHFSSGAAYELYPDTKSFFSTIAQLKSRWAKAEDPPLIVGVITNSDPRVTSVLQSLGLEVGVSKPQTRAEIVSSLPNAPDLARRYKWSNDINVLLTSYDTGVEKPNSKMYAAAMIEAMQFYVIQKDIGNMPTSALGLLQSAARDVTAAWAQREITRLHIGDDFEKDYQGAKMAGWEALYLNRNGEEPEAEGVDTVRDLDEAALMISVMVEQNFSKTFQT